MGDPEAGLMMMMRRRSCYNRGGRRQQQSSSSSSSSSRSIKVFGNYQYHQLHNNNKKKKKKRTQLLQAAEIIGSKNIMIDKDDKQKKKKMKMMMMLNRCSSSSSSSPSKANANANAQGDDHISNNTNYAVVDDDFVVYEILVRLPVKTLMRFKSACKRWMSTIQHDPQFHHLHFKKYSETSIPPIRRLTISSVAGSLYREITGYRVSDANLMKGVLYHTFPQCKRLFSVHGLVCMLDLPGHALRIYNPSTRQGTQWIDKPIKHGRIMFGFDPVTMKHKVLCRGTMKPATYEVLTVGENSWRRIDRDPQVPNDNPYRGRSVYLNGAIYWMEKISRKKRRKKKLGSGYAEVLVAFDVGSEKFRVIPIPDFIINQPRDESYWYVHVSRGPFTDDLLEVNGRLALLRRKDKNTVSMWMFEDDRHGNWNWTEVVITLPFDWVGKDAFVYFDNVPGTDQIILNSYDDWRHFAYSHNWQKNTSEKLETTGGLASEIDNMLYCKPVTTFSLRDRSQIEIQSRHTHFRESIFPVN